MDWDKIETAEQYDEKHQSLLLQKMGDGYCAAENYEQALRHYEQAALLDPDASGPYVGMGFLEYHQGDLDKAELSFKVARRLEPICSRAYLGLAGIAQKRENFALAFEMYLKSIESDPENLLALLGLFQVSCQMGTFGKIIGYLESYLDAHPKDSAVMSCLASLYIRDNKFTLAKHILTRAINIAPDNKVAADLLEEVEYNLSKRKEVCC